MKKVFSVLVGLIIACAVCNAQDEEKNIPNTPPRSNPKVYTLQAGNTVMSIDANYGARIFSLKKDGEEMLSELEMPNMFGSTFWTSPQAEWNWPPVREIDSMPYSVYEAEGQLIMTSQLSPKIKIRIQKIFEVDPEDNAFVITYRMINESGMVKRVAPWEITRVLNQGAVFFDAPVSQITPAGLMPFVDNHGLSWMWIDKDYTQNRKINSDGKGWLAYLHNNTVLIKRFPDIDPSQAAPGEAEIQVYIHRGDVYVELENQGAYTTLQPNDQMDWTVRWYVKTLQEWLDE